MQQHAERVDVGGGGHLAAAHHFGTGVERRHHARLARRHRGVGGAALEGEARDTEVEQLHLAAVGDQDVAGLDVAMHDQAAVRVAHRVAHGQEEAQARRDVEPRLVAVAIDRRALDVFHDEVWQAVGGRAAVEQPRDVRMFQPCQDLALGPELPHALRIEQAAHHLDGDLLQELVVVAFGEVDGAHAAFAEHAHQAVRTEAFERGRRRGGDVVDGVLHDVGQRASRLLGVVSLHQVVDEARELDIGRLGVDVGGAGGRRLLERRFEEPLCRGPAFGGHRRGAWGRRQASSVPPSPVSLLRSHALAKRSSRWTVAGEMPTASAVSS